MFPPPACRKSPQTITCLLGFLSGSRTTTGTLNVKPLEPEPSQIQASDLQPHARSPVMTQQQGLTVLNLKFETSQPRLWLTGSGCPAFQANPQGSLGELRARVACPGSPTPITVKTSSLPNDRNNHAKVEEVGSPWMSGPSSPLAVCAWYSVMPASQTHRNGSQALIGHSCGSLTLLQSLPCLLSQAIEYADAESPNAQIRERPCLAQTFPPVCRAV